MDENISSVLSADANPGGKYARPNASANVSRANADASAGTEEGGLLGALLGTRKSVQRRVIRPQTVRLQGAEGIQKSQKFQKPQKSQKGGLVEALLNTHEQVGGADSYAWHRAQSNIAGVANARSHLLSAKRLPWETQATSGEEKRAAWIQEVRDVMTETGLSWKQALEEASRRRKQNVPQYQTVVERVKNSYTGRVAANVNCAETGRCPGRYTKGVVRDEQGEIKYRPNAHNASKVHLTADAATSILRDYYRQRASGYKRGLSGATKAMRQDISKLNTTRVVQSPCPTKLITVTRKDGKVYQRRIVDKAHPDYAACRSNWLYRNNPGKFDMEGVDAKDGKNSPAYGKTVLHASKGRKQRTKKPSRRLVL